MRVAGVETRLSAGSSLPRHSDDIDNEFRSCVLEGWGKITYESDLDSSDSLVPTEDGINFIAVRRAHGRRPQVIPFLLETTLTACVEQIAQNSSEALHLHHVHFCVSGNRGLRHVPSLRRDRYTNVIGGGNSRLNAD